MINGQEYAFEDIKLTIAGFPAVTIQEVEYTSKKEITPIYGQGSKPRAHGRGKEEYSAKIVLLQSDVIAMLNTLPRAKRKLTYLAPFNVVVCYATEGGPVTTDIIKSCKVPEFKHGIKQGDGQMPIEIPLVALDIEYSA